MVAGTAGAGGDVTAEGGAPEVATIAAQASLRIRFIVTPVSNVSYLLDSGYGWVHEPPLNGMHPARLPLCRGRLPQNGCL